MDCFQNPIDQLWMEVTARLIVSVGKKSRRTQGRCSKQITIEGVLTYVNFAKERTAATCFVKSSKRLSTQMDDLLLIIFVRVSFFHGRQIRSVGKRYYFESTYVALRKRLILFGIPLEVKQPFDRYWTFVKHYYI